MVCCVPLVGGFLAGVIGIRELGFLFAPAFQWALCRPRWERGWTPADCIQLTHLGSALLLVYLMGNRVWLMVGLPPNIKLG